MTLIDAVLEIIENTGLRSNTKKSLARLRKACNAIGLSQEETARIEARLEYRPNADEEPFSYLVNIRKGK